MRRAATATVALAAALFACGDSSGGSSPSGVAGTVTVLAASSLTEAFGEMATEFESQYPGTSADVSFSASSQLAAQIEQGAPADVLASADEATMHRLVDSGDVDVEPVVFARNRLAVAVENGNPEGIEGLADLAGDGLVVVLCAEQVPCGRFADAALAGAGVSVAPASRAGNVKAALSLVELGEADAAIVYVTDVQANGSVDAVEIPDEHNVIARYPIAPLVDATNPGTATAFVEFVRSERGQAVLRRFGFLEP